MTGERMMRKIAMIAIAAMMFVCGCVSVDYVGQQFPEIEEDEPVIIFRQNSDYPASEYKVIGRATFTAPDGYASIELDEKIEDTARSYGAQAVKVISFERTVIGSDYVQPSTSRQQVSITQGTTGLSNDGSQLYTDSFGDQVSMEGKRITRYDLVAKTLFLIKRTRYEKLERQFEKSRQENDERPTMFNPSADQPAAPAVAPVTAPAVKAPAAEPAK